MEGVILLNKTVLITRSSQGLGPNLAQSLVNEGCNVIIHYNHHKELANDLVKKLGNKQAIAVHADPSRTRDITILVKLATKHFGQIDAMVNNDLSPVTSTNQSLHTLDSVAQQLLPQFIKQKEGSIISLHQTPAKETEQKLVTDFTRDYAHNYKEKGIRINSITSSMPQEKLLNSTPIQHDLTNIISYLVSDSSKEITGKIITL